METLNPRYYCPSYMAHKEHSLLLHIHLVNTSSAWNRTLRGLCPLEGVSWWVRASLVRADEQVLCRTGTPGLARALGKSWARVSAQQPQKGVLSLEGVQRRATVLIKGLEKQEPWGMVERTVIIQAWKQAKAGG